MYHIFFIDPYVDGHLGCFRALSVVNSAAMNIVVHVFFWIKVNSGYLNSNRIGWIIREVCF